MNKLSLIALCLCLSACGPASESVPKVGSAPAGASDPLFLEFEAVPGPGQTFLMPRAGRVRLPAFAAVRSAGPVPGEESVLDVNGLICAYRVNSGEALARFVSCTGPGAAGDLITVPQGSEINFRRNGGGVTMSLEVTVL